MAEHDRRNPSPITLLSAPLLLRFGVSDTMEFRIETEGPQRVIDHNNATIRGGTGDTAVGLKWHSQDRDPVTNTPAISWIFHVAAPTGTNGFEGHGPAPSLRAVLTWELPHDLALGFMPGVRYGSAPDGHRYASLISGLVLNKQWTPRWRTFIENSAPQIARADNGGVVMAWDAGAAYLLTSDWQIGVRGGVAANHNTPNNFLLVELAGRF
jgi:Putative MetA-pathway of phenol degradation